MMEGFDERAATWDRDPLKTERVPAVARQIAERVTLTPHTDVLDFGSGTGLLGFHFLPRVGSVTFADPSEGMLREVEAKLRNAGGGRGGTLRLDPEALALPGCYGVIVSLMTLRHVPDPAAVIHFLADHLEPGGWLALCDPLAYVMRLERPGGVREYPLFLLTARKPAAP